MPAGNDGPGLVDLDYSVEEGLDGRWDEAVIARLVQGIVSRERPPGTYALSLHLVSDESIQELNREHRGMDKPTDVLSFPLEDEAEDFVTPPGHPVALGDVVVSLPRSRAQAEEYGHSPERELTYLVAHGVLHILGYDHEDPDEQRVMRAKEEEALEPLGLTRDPHP